MKCPLKDCNAEVFEMLDMPCHVLSTCLGKHEVLIPKEGIKTESNIRCIKAQKEGFRYCKFHCEYEWCKYNIKYKDLNPTKGYCPVCGSIWDDDEEYCKKCIEDSKNA